MRSVKDQYPRRQLDQASARNSSGCWISRFEVYPKLGLLDFGGFWGQGLSGCRSFFRVFRIVGVQAVQGLYSTVYGSITNTLNSQQAQGSGYC